MKLQDIDNEPQKKWMRLVARAWTDDALKHRLLTDPVPVLREHGIEVPAGVEVSVVEPSDRQLYLLLPPPPTAGTELTANELAGVAGGATGGETPTESVTFEYGTLQVSYSVCAIF